MQGSMWRARHRPTVSIVRDKQCSRSPSCHWDQRHHMKRPRSDRFLDTAVTVSGRHETCRERHKCTQVPNLGVCLCSGTREVGVLYLEDADALFGAADRHHHISSQIRDSRLPWTHGKVHRVVHVFLFQARAQATWRMASVSPPPRLPQAKKRKQVASRKTSPRLAAIRWVLQGSKCATIHVSETGFTGHAQSHLTGKINRLRWTNNWRTAVRQHRGKAWIGIIATCCQGCLLMPWTRHVLAALANPIVCTCTVLHIYCILYYKKQTQLGINNVPCQHLLQRATMAWRAMETKAIAAVAVANGASWRAWLMARCSKGASKYIPNPHPKKSLEKSPLFPVS
jgi:hypothetical protein